MYSGDEKVSMIDETGSKAKAAESGHTKSTGSKRKNTAAAKKPGRTSGKKGGVIKLAENSPAGRKQIEGILPEEVVFALDIGTRTIVGVVGIQEEECFRVIATEVCAHKHRAMLDGQIHDIEQVAAVASAVREKLESRLGFKLKKVAIAAAGRVLRTCQVRVDKDLEQGREIDAELISSLEIEGIQRAQMLLDEDMPSEDKTQFYCVGYSVINYYLNGYIITRLAGHKGKSMGVDVLATFLPLIVVDSLYTVMSKIGLEVSSLTLEPIAAINATIPQDLRLLNLALIDIGAGTSDIALTKEGSVIAYAMVPQAGDEITEMISQHYLVDFNTGEKIKIALSQKKDNIVFTDILKIKHSVTREEVLKVIESTMQMLASTIAQRILEYNHKAPNAIFLVGGGSRTPGLSEMIAKQLELPAERVVVRGRDVIRDIKFSDKNLHGPESITPFGIALTAQLYRGKDFMTVSVNERKIKLFNSKKLTVADALILFGFDASQLIGRTGKGISFFVNGEKKQIRGEYGKAAEIFVNTKVASLDTSIAYGDNIRVIPAEDGKDAAVKILDLVPKYKMGRVLLNGNPVDISTIVHVNGKHVSKDELVHDGDLIQISGIHTLKDLLDAGGLDEKLCGITLNGSSDYELNYVLQDGDEVSCVERRDTSSASDRSTYAAIAPAAYTATVPVSTANPQKAPVAADSPNSTLAVPIILDSLNSSQAAPDIGSAHLSDLSSGFQSSSSGVEVKVNGRNVVLKENRAQYIFVDIFNYIDFDLTKPQGTIVLKLNGKQAAFTDVIRSGDTIEIYWNK